jgi:hypothetical protein
MMSAMKIRWLAIISMIFGYTAILFFSLLPTKIVIGMNAIGSISMPLFCFLVAEGLFHTNNIRIYLARLMVFALLSEIPYDLAMYNSPLNWNGQNAIFTLFLGLFAIWVYDYGAGSAQKWISLCAILSCGAVATLIHAESALVGVYYIFIFYLFRGNSRRLMIWVTIGVLLGLYNEFAFDPSSFHISSLGALAAVPVILLYNGKRGGLDSPPPKTFQTSPQEDPPETVITRELKARPKIFHHWFQLCLYLLYPLHLLILWIFSQNIK